jgi:hypothetical protein
MVLLMATALSTYLDPSAYTDEAVAAARTGDVATLNNDLRIVRLACTLHDHDLDGSKRLIELLEGEALSGHALFKARTAALFVTAQEGDQAAFDRALASWMAGRDAWPGNWIDEVLNAPELRAMLPTLHPALVRQREAAQRTMAHEELTFIRDLPFVIIRAVQDNLEWLRPIDPKATISDFADRYKLIAVNLDLCEATLEGRHGAPDLIVALSADGHYTGSFIAH